MANSPNFTASPVLAVASVSTANTNRDGTGTIVSLLTGATNGTRVDEVWSKATGSTTGGMLRFFLSPDGSTWTLFVERQVSAITPSGTQGAWEDRFTLANLNLPSGWQLGVATNNAESFRVYAFGGLF